MSAFDLSGQLIHTDSRGQGNALLRLGDILHWNPERVSVQAGLQNTVLSFQRSYFPIIEVRLDCNARPLRMLTLVEQSSLVSCVRPRPEKHCTP